MWTATGILFVCNESRPEQWLSHTAYVRGHILTLQPLYLIGASSKSKSIVLDLRTVDLAEVELAETDHALFGETGVELRSRVDGVAENPILLGVRQPGLNDLARWMSVFRQAAVRHIRITLASELDGTVASVAPAPLIAEPEPSSTWALLPPHSPSADWRAVSTTEDHTDDCAWYRRYFANQAHANFVAALSPRQGGAVVVSLKREATKVKNGFGVIRAILWSLGVVHPFVIAAPDSFRSFRRDLQTVLSRRDPHNLGPKWRRFKCVVGAGLVRRLLAIERTLSEDACRVGLMYAADGDVVDPPPLGHDPVFDDLADALAEYGIAIIRPDTASAMLAVIVLVSDGCEISVDVLKHSFVTCCLAVSPDGLNTYQLTLAAKKGCLSGTGAVVGSHLEGSPSVAAAALLAAASNAARMCVRCSQADNFISRATRTRDLLLDAAVLAVNEGRVGFEVGPVCGLSVHGTDATDRPPLVLPKRDVLTALPLDMVSEGQVLAWGMWQNQIIYSDVSGIHLAGGGHDSGATITTAAASMIHVVECLNVAVIKFKDLALGVGFVFLDSIGLWLVHSVPQTAHSTSVVVSHSNQANHPVFLSVVSETQLRIFKWIDNRFSRAARRDLGTAARLSAIDRSHIAVTLPTAVFEVGLGPSYTLRTIATSDYPNGDMAVLAISRSRILVLDGLVSVMADREALDRSQPTVMVHWVGTPQQVVELGPYLVGASVAGLEIRSSSNGALVQVMNMPRPVSILWHDTSGLVVSAGGAFTTSLPRPTMSGPSPSRISST
ncbi:uncharacterized protein AMSG_09905 [Thecamonas trahens ATCC 50062]|uniref:CNH domain-containing protein n=1 Tax=Thecamonas trahens ATCC 50062 TaxID=461836 RepID=A0A0L0DRS7_THETB|nr:hypothetical protein AMSG_09905 [Thecamonas trahens ATCC 50062]KNC54128.1 hypothetical protein AMSG_09905 [Thecamonas trahens ATCC 50062]|eukprot:XP_013753950.1 hypothetical protein AMSG_09905 [Thecamonas trahens ATCC 50062]